MTTSPPSAEELLARWGAHFRAGDVAGLAGLYHSQAHLIGSTPTPSSGRDAITAYFTATRTPGADVAFSAVEGQGAGPEVLLVLARAEFSAPGITLPMWLTQTWVADGSDWLVASHHASRA